MRPALFRLCFGLIRFSAAGAYAGKMLLPDQRSVPRIVAPPTTVSPS